MKRLAKKTSVLEFPNKAVVDWPGQLPQIPQPMPNIWLIKSSI